MSKSRLEAFSDGVIAIIITITILLIDVPSGNDWKALKTMFPLFAVYAVSFMLLGSHWANHHHLFQIASHVNGKIIWANLLYLFVISFFPVLTGWVGKSDFAQVPTIVYVIINMAESLSYMLLQTMILHSQDCVILKRVVDESKKELVTIVTEIAALICAFIYPIHVFAYPLLVVSALIWVVPDIRMSRVFEERMGEEE
ncbi:MAG: TMEM175 family protein [Lachnospiraceae bacterium]|nr:TMEM175 family protein [Lachnospiraceae bacterium]